MNKEFDEKICVELFIKRLNEIKNNPLNLSILIEAIYKIQDWELALEIKKLNNKEIHLHDLLKSIFYKSKDLSWMYQYNTIEEMVLNCNDGDWFLYLAYRLNISKNLILQAKVECVETIKHLFIDGENIRSFNIAKKYVFTNDINTETFYEAKFRANKQEYQKCFADYASVCLLYIFDDFHPELTNTIAQAILIEFDNEILEKENKLKTSEICRKILGKSIIELINKLKPN